MKQIYNSIIGTNSPIGSKNPPGKYFGFLKLIPTKWQVKAFFSLLCVLFTAHAFAVDYYAAPAPLGVAANNGLSQTTPKTLAAAAIIAGPGDRVLLMPGIYRETAEIRKDGATFMPAPGVSASEVIINGTDAMISWAAAAGSTYSTTMSWDLNTESTAGTGSRRIGTNQVFQDGRIMELARWPKRPVELLDTAMMLMNYNAHADNTILGSGQITIVDADFNGDTRWIGAKIWINLARHKTGLDGNGTTATVTGVSNGNIIVAMASPRPSNAPWGTGPNTEYFLFDPAPAALPDAAAVNDFLAPGEWWKKGTTLYVKTRNESAPANSATAGSNLIEAKRRHFGFWPDLNNGLNRHSYIIQDLTLFGCAITTDRGFRNDRIVEGAHDIVLQRLTVKYPNHNIDMFSTDPNYVNTGHLGWTGIVLNGRNNTIQDCDISFSSTSAISFQGIKSKMLRNRLHNNNYLCVASGVVNTGVNCVDSEIGHNIIFNTTHQGINVRGVLNSNRAVKHQARVHHNTIYDFMMRSYDSGAIDAGVKDLQWARIDHNIIYNTRPEARIGARKYGIYFDYGQQGTLDFNRIGVTVDHNVVYDVNNPATLNAGWDMHIYNNVLLTVDQSVINNPEGSRGLTVGMDIGGSLAGINVRAHNNIISDPPPARWKSPPTYIFNNITDAKGAVLEELFVDATNPNLAARNYQLKPTATRAIDQGMSVNEFTDNYPLDRPVVGITDIGAFEYPTSTISADTVAPSVPDSASFVVANKNGTSFLFSWAPSTDNVGVAYYEIYSNGALLTQTPTTSYQLQGLDGSTTYVIKVLAIDGSGNRSELSKALDVKTTAPVPNVDIAKTFTGISIDGIREAAWGEGLPITRVFGAQPTSATDLSSTWSGLWDADNLYLFIDVNDDVKATDGGANWWEDDHIEIMIDGEGTQPTAYGVKQHQYFISRAGSFSESKHSTTSMVGVQSSRVEKADGSGYILEVKIPVSSLGLTAQPLAIMGIDVQVGDDDDGGAEDTRIGWHSTINEVYFRPNLMGVAKLTAPGIEDDTTPPTAPTGLTSSAIFPDQFTVTWNPSSDNLGVYSYEVFVNNNLVGTPKVTNFTVKGLTAGSTYKVDVRAKDRFNNLSPKSSVLTVITPTKASAVKYESELATITPGSGVTAVATAIQGYTGTGYVTGISNNNGGVAITYNITVPEAGSYSAYMHTTNNAGVMSLYVNGTRVGNVLFPGPAVPGTWQEEYGLFVLPNLVAGSNAIMFKHDGGQTPSNQNSTFQDHLGVLVPISSFKGALAPTNLNATNITNNGFTLNWTPSSGNTVTGYDVYQDDILVGSTPDNSLTIVSLEQGTTYQMTVKARTSQGNQSDGSTALTVLTTGTGSRQVTGVVVTPDVNDLVVGQTVQLLASITPANANNKLLHWTSGNDFIATVDSTGKVTTKNVGTATITATSKDGSNKTGSAQITVSRPWIKVDDNALNSGITYDANWAFWQRNRGYLGTEHNTRNTELLPEATFRFTGSRVKLYGPTRYDLGIGQVYLDGTLVATFDEYGLNGEEVYDKMLWDSGELTGGAHTVVIKATNTTNQSPNRLERHKVTIITIDAFEYSPYTQPDNLVAGVSITPASATVAEGSQVTLNASVSPSNANQGVTWTSLSPNIASVNNGVVTGLQAGNSVIRATSIENNAKFKDVTITVSARPAPVPVISAGGALTFCPSDSVVLTSTEAPAYQWYKGASALEGQTSRSLTATQSGAYTVEVTYDGGAKRTSAPITVSAEDNIKPIVRTKNISVELTSGTATVTAADIDSASTDNCGIASMSLDKTSFSCEDIGTKTVILTVNDKSGNAETATATVTVTDSAKPVVLTKNISVELVNGTATITAADVNNGSTDNCGIASMSLDKTSFTCADAGPQTVLLTVTDNSGNTESGTATVTIKDSTSPVVLTKNISVALVNGSATITAADVNNGSTDNCGITSLSLDKTTFSCAEIGNQTVRLTATDAFGNTASQTATVTVIGSVPTPAIAVSRTNNTYTGLDLKTIALGYGAQSLTLTASSNSSASNTYSWSPATGLSNTGIANPVFTPKSAGTYTFTVTATSQSGCKASASVTIKVIDVRCGSNGKVVVCKKDGTRKASESCVNQADAATLLKSGGATLGACTSGVLAADGSERSLVDLSAIDALTSIRLTSYPNPFANQTTVSFTVPQAEQKVTLVIFDAIGNRITTLYSGKAEANVKNEFVFDSSALPAGAYFARLITSKGSQSFKLILAR